LEKEYRRLFVTILVSAVLVTVLLSRFSFPGAPVSNVSAMNVAQNLGVYWDMNCTQSAFSIDWGVLSPGELRTVVVYVKNEGNESIVLSLTPQDWIPGNASRYLSFTWDSEDKMLEVGQVARVAQTLAVDRLIIGISSFSFNILVEARAYFLGDMNRDGAVNYRDFTLLAIAWGSSPTDLNWFQHADLNKDNSVDALDYFLFNNDYGKS
jgi:hypothetical protein